VWNRIPHLRKEVEEILRKERILWQVTVVDNVPAEAETTSPPRLKQMFDKGSRHLYH
jgi:ABC-type ATPase involved in cell division